MNIVYRRYLYDGLRYPKSDEKPPFQTRAEIERQLSGLPPKRAAKLWEALYLTLPEAERLPAHVEDRACHPWIYLLVATAAEPGASKGELLRMRIGDVDFAAGVVSIQEKKRAQGRRTTRRVPLSSTLAAILTDWLRLAKDPSWRPVPVRSGRACRAAHEAEPHDRAPVERPARHRERTAGRRQGANAARHPAADRR
jgi:integrase